MSALLLDTCALIWIAQDATLDPDAKAMIGEAAVRRTLFVSPASAWEIGLLSRPRAGRAPDPVFSPDPKIWFGVFMARRAVKLAALTPWIAIDSSHLPGALHCDPADRLIIATARHLGAAIVTRDRKILDYAQAGFVEAVAC